LILGIDLGSRNVKLAVWNEGDLHFHRYDTMDFYRKFGQRVGDSLRIDYSKLGIPPADRVVSTGYGRLTVKVEHGVVIPEIKAHVLGAIGQTGLEDFTLLDLGGQDTKVVKVIKGKMVDFQTNDKCAASSGRFLENMAGILGISLEEMGNCFQDPVELSSTCAVFGESELIGRIIEGVSLEKLAAGINQTVVNRIKPMLGQLLSSVVIFTGGVAYSSAIKELIQRQMDVEIVVPPQPQFNGAIGCCLYGRSN